MGGNTFKICQFQCVTDVIDGSFLLSVILCLSRTFFVLIAFFGYFQSACQTFGINHGINGTGREALACFSDVWSSDLYRVTPVAVKTTNLHDGVS